MLYLNTSSKYWQTLRNQLNDKEKKTEKDNGFLYIITRVEDIIFCQKFEHAATGFFKENLNGSLKLLLLRKGIRVRF